MRCVIQEDEVITLHGFYRGLNDDFRKVIRFLIVPFLGFNLGMMVLCRKIIVMLVSKFIKRKIKANESSIKYHRTSSKVQCVKCQDFDHNFVNCFSKPLVIKEHKDLGEKKEIIMFHCMNSVLRI